jgi:hypothetical protein
VKNKSDPVIQRSRDLDMELNVVCIHFMAKAHMSIY